MDGHIQVGPWLVEPSLNIVSRNGTAVHLEPKVMEVLLCLARHAGEVIPKEELLKAVWPDTFVTEDALKRCISELRRVFEDDAREPRVIETIPKRGYRLVAPVVPAKRARDSSTQATPSPAITGAAGIGARRVWRWAVAVGVAVLILLLLLSLRGRRADTGAVPPIHSLAVLPLQNLSADPAQEYFSDGLTDALITELAQIDSVKVISRTSTIQYKGTKKTLPEIARELKVDGVIEGTVQRSGDRLRITTQLIQGATDKHVWAASYEGDLRDVLTLESEVARSIAGAIRLQLTPVQKSRLAGAPQIDREAYDLYLKGRYFWNKRNPSDLKKAVEYFQEAAEKEPSYAAAQTGLADAYALLGAAGFDVMPAAEAMEKSRAAATKALGIDNKLAEAHTSLAFVVFSYDWDWVTAEKEFRQAIALNPNYATAHQWYSELLNDMARDQEALEQAQAALALDPLSLNAIQGLERAHYFARRFDEAIETSRKALELDPSFAIAHLRLGRAYAAKGMYGTAIKEFQEFARLSGDEPLALASIGNARAQSGDRQGAMRSLEELMKLAKRRPVSSMCFALVYEGLGNSDQTLAALERARQERSDFLLVLKVDPLFDGLRSDPRFEDLLRRIGLSADT